MYKCVPPALYNRISLKMAVMSAAAMAIAAIRRSRGEAEGVSVCSEAANAVKVPLTWLTESQVCEAVSALASLLLRFILTP